MAGDDLDALGYATLLGLVVVAIVAVSDLFVTGRLEPGVLALVGAVLTPLVPALVSRGRKPRK